MSICVVVFPAERGWFVAACVEHDIVTQGRTIEDVHYNMEMALYVHVLLDVEQGLPPLSTTPQAPAAYRRAFMAAETDLRMGPLGFRGGPANDTPVTEETRAAMTAPRHYRYTDRRPPCPPIRLP